MYVNSSSAQEGDDGKTCPAACFAAAEVCAHMAAEQMKLYLDMACKGDTGSKAEVAHVAQIASYLHVHGLTSTEDVSGHLVLTCQLDLSRNICSCTSYIRWGCCRFTAMNASGSMICVIHDASTEGILTTGKGTYCTRVASLKYPAMTHVPLKASTLRARHSHMSAVTCLQGSATTPLDRRPDAEVQGAWIPSRDARGLDWQRLA